MPNWTQDDGTMCPDAERIFYPGRFSKKKVRTFVRGMRDQAQVSLDCTPAENKIAVARAMGRRDAYDTILDALDENLIEGPRTNAARPK